MYSTVVVIINIVYHVGLSYFVMYMYNASYNIICSQWVYWGISINFKPVKHPPSLPPSPQSFTQDINVWHEERGGELEQKFDNHYSIVTALEEIPDSL